MADELLTVNQAAEILGRKRMAIFRRIWAGQIEAINVALPTASRPIYRIRRAALDAYLQRNTIRQPERRVA